jgi:hypothetical protein
MRKWTWQWLVLLGLLGALLSCCAWIDRESYNIDEDFYTPSNPWKQMIWEARVADLSSYRASRHMPSASLGQDATLSLGIGHRVRGQTTDDRDRRSEVRGQIADFGFRITDWRPAKRFLSKLI